ncbi:MAG: hypothetical protein NTY39_08060 [Campylobacterales bacterium]|nr:hypothetical protein [Campylobacterales bacterium]
MTIIISSVLDQQIRSAKSTNTANAQKLENVMDEVYKLIDPEKVKLSNNEAKEIYMNSKIDQMHII